MDKVKIMRPQDIIPLLERWANSRQENFIGITLNGAHEVIKVRCLTKGIANRTIIHPREAFYPAIKDNAIGVVFAHNHPSGDLRYSPEDENVTRRFVAAADILGFHLLDHIIFTGRPLNWLSLRREGLIVDSGEYGSEWADMQGALKVKNNF